MKEDVSKWSKSRLINFIKFLEKEVLVEIDFFIRLYDEVERGN